MATYYNEADHLLKEYNKAVGEALELGVYCYNDRGDALSLYELRAANVRARLARDHAILREGEGFVDCTCGLRFDRQKGYRSITGKFVPPVEATFLYASHQERLQARLRGYAAFDL